MSRDFGAHSNGEHHRARDTTHHLDTDDIGGAVGDLEKHVDATGVLNIFVSKGYFMSKNCLREAIQTVRKGKPLTLVFDPVWGAQGLSLEELMLECPEVLPRSGDAPHKLRAHEELTAEELAAKEAAETLTALHVQKVRAQLGTGRTREKLVKAKQLESKL